MNQKIHIKRAVEKTVTTFYKVSKEDLYDTGNNEYPLAAARSVLMYLLYASKEYRIYEIQALFGYSNRRTVELRLATVASSIKKGTNKLAEDMTTIQSMLNDKNK